MAVASGTKLGPYEIQSPLGAGGMGEVYRARDTRLDRTVAIKIIPAHLAEHPDLKQRFEREARAISSLSHPHICHLYDVGSQEGINFLVLEYLEGETLAERLMKGPLPIEQVLKTGAEIADALDKAHRQGIVHRDLKPANIMLTKAGAKLMDFGLAKPASAVMSPVASGGGPLAPSTPTMSLRSLSAPAKNLTQQGMVVGTFQYMAPEVLQGAEADARSDIFSLGCVLYEMATGKRAFEGKSQISVLAAILEKEPEPISQLQPLTPPSFERVVKSCLTKDPEARVQTAHDLKLQLQLVSEVAPAAPATSRTRVTTLAAFATLLVVMAAAFAWLWPRSKSADLPLMQLSIVLPSEMSISALSPPVISPDATTVVFVARTREGPDSLYLRRLDSPVIRHFDGTEMATYPFWSPDSSAVAFFAAGQIKRVDIATGAVQSVTEAPDGRGGAWSKDGVIIFSPRAGSPLFRVNASGGVPQQLTDLKGNQSHRWPSFLPDGRHFVYTGQTGTAPGGIFLASLDETRGRVLTSEVVNGQVVNDYLVFAHGTSIVAARLDLKTAKLAPEIALGAEHVRVIPDRNLAEFSIANNGAMAYATGVTNDMQLAWFDRSGRRLETINSPEIRGEFDLSRDGRYLVTDYNTPDGQQRVELLDLRRGPSPVARTLKPAESPVLSPTGESFVFGGNDLVRKWVDGSEREQILVKGSDSMYPDHWSRDGRWLIYEIAGKQTNFDLMLLDMHGKGEPQVYLRTPANEAHSRISPDGRWLAYVSDESGRPEVYVQSFPTPGGGKWQISTQGGDQPCWRSDGGELYFLASSDLALMSVPIVLGKTFDPGVPKKLFTTRSIVAGITGSRNNYVAADDGKRFLILYVPEEAGSSTIGIVINWQQKMKSVGGAAGR